MATIKRRPLKYGVISDCCGAAVQEGNKCTLCKLQCKSVKPPDDIPIDIEDDDDDWD